MNIPTLRVPYRPIIMGLLLMAPLAFVLDRAQAGDSHYYPPVTDPVVAEECGSCHLAFPPSMLPARSWTVMMANLEDHFGDDASLSADATRHIEAYLVERAADRGGQRYVGKLLRGVGAREAPQRITELPKWVHEHDEVRQSRWSDPEVRSKANCAACHRDAEQGYYDDD